jgi:hypothetical protein
MKIFMPSLGIWSGAGMTTKSKPDFVHMTGYDTSESENGRQCHHLEAMLSPLDE